MGFPASGLVLKLASSASKSGTLTSQGKAAIGDKEGDRQVNKCCAKEKQTPSVLWPPPQQLDMQRAVLPRPFRSAGLMLMMVTSS